MQKMKIRIDDTEVEVTEGQTILEAARITGTDILRYVTGTVWNTTLHAWFAL